MLRLTTVVYVYLIHDVMNVFCMAVCVPVGLKSAAQPESPVM